MDAAAIAEAVVTKVTSLLERKLAPVLARIEQLEAREVPSSESLLKALLRGTELTTLVDATVAEYLEENPPPPGEKGADGRDGRDGADGKDGANGVGLAGAMIDRGGELIVTTTNGQAIKLGPVVGSDGKDGKDGLSFETATGEYDSERGFVIRLAAGNQSTEFVLPYMVHRGFWREGLGVKAGESITHDGALWIAKRANASKPCLENSDDWYLAARKGRDGKDGRSVNVPQAPVKLGG